jgi:UDP-N-acetylmuramate--alanine ligase
MKIHCIGIGGIGLSALARYYLSQGCLVSGSDQSESELLVRLQEEGVQIFTSQKKENLPDGVDLVVYTIAIPETNEELVEARKRGITIKTYPQALGDVTKEKTTIAVCGTHGKTTTTAMTYHALKACGINPTVIVGSLLADKGTNFILGDSDYLIVEACEYKRSFLNLHPKHIIVTNIDEDHLDYYKDIDDIKSAFQSFADKVANDGSITSHGDVTLLNAGISVNADEKIDSNTIELSVMGNHNRLNAQLVIACLSNLGFEEKKLREGVKCFHGTWRRMEYKGENIYGVSVYDDYGHHPKEIFVSISALRENYPEKKIAMLFQPHLYSRTKALFDDFVSVLSIVDHVYILPIYRARQEDTTVVNEKELLDAIVSKGGSASLCSLGEIKEKVESWQDTSYVIVNMGAGNAFEEINKCSLSKH